MAYQLQPQDIADCFTLVQINERITNILASITLAEQSVLDSFSDVQAQQRVQRQTLKDLNDSLAIWIKAKNILSGADSSTANQEAYNYNPTIPKV